MNQNTALPLIIRNSNKNMTVNFNSTNYSGNIFNDSKDSTRMGSTTQMSSPKGNSNTKDNDSIKMKTSFNFGMKKHNEQSSKHHKIQVFKEESQDNFHQQINKSNIMPKDDQDQHLFKLDGEDSFEIVEGTNELRMQTPQNSIIKNRKSLSKLITKIDQEKIQSQEDQDSPELNSPISPFPISKDRFFERTQNQDYMNDWSLKEGVKPIKNTRYSNNISKPLISLHDSQSEIHQTDESTQIFKNRDSQQYNTVNESEIMYQQEHIIQSNGINTQPSGYYGIGEIKLDQSRQSIDMFPGEKLVDRKKSTQGQYLININSSNNNISQTEEMEDSQKNQDDQNQSSNLHMTYKQIHRVVESNTYFKLGQSAQQKYLQAIVKNEMLPKKMNTIPLTQPVHQMINLNGYSVNEQYSNIIGTSINHRSYNSLQHLKAQDSNMSNLALSQVVMHLPTSINELSLQKNRLTKVSSSSITGLLSKREYENLTYLNLENNNLQDFGAIKIFDILAKNSSLRILNLSNNHFTDLAATKAIGFCLHENKSLEELYLHFNMIKNQGAVAIAEGLKENNSIRVLDLSFNCIGSGVQGEKLKGAKAIISSITNYDRSAMLHLDLSYNCVGEEEAREIDEILKQNQRVYGLHFEGNCGALVDPRGFLHFPSKDELVSKAIRRGNMKPRISGLKKLDSKKYQCRQYRSSDICWLCEGWQEINFHCKFEGEALEEPFFIHLNFENFRPTLLYQKSDLQGQRHHEFYVQRLCPPNAQIIYFFSSPTKNKTLINSKQQHQPLKSVMRDHQMLNQPTVNVQFNEGTRMDLNFPPNVNIWFTSKLETPIFDQYITLQIESKPRVIEPAYVITPPQQIYWGIPISLFKDWRPDSEVVVNECFQSDWANSKITQFVKSETDLQRLQKILRHHYEVIKNEYKVLAAMGGIGDVPCVTSNGFTEFFMGTRAIDNKLLKISDIDFNFVAVNAGGPKEQNALNPDRALVRYQFLQILVRLAADQYFKSGETQSVSDAVVQLLEDDGVLYRMEEEENQQNWRDSRYWNMECDNVLKSKYDFIKQLYDRFAGSRTNEKKAFTSIKRMSVSEFKDFINYYSLFNQNFVERDAGVAFNLSMISQVDQIGNDRHTQMQMMQFLEALARIAEQSSLVSMINRDYADYSLEQRQELPLYIKLEGLFYYLANPHLLQRESLTDKKATNNPTAAIQNNVLGRFTRSKNRNVTSSFVLMVNSLIDNTQQRKRTESQASISGSFMQQQDAPPDALNGPLGKLDEEIIKNEKQSNQNTSDESDDQ